MIGVAVLDLVHNISVLLAMAFVFDFALSRFRHGHTVAQKILFGLAISPLVVIVMLTPWTYQPGIVFDTRSILISLSGLFFGPVTTGVVGLAAILFRLHMGGAGVLTGVLSVLSSALIGAAWRSVRKKRPIEMGFAEFFLFGLFVHVVLLAVFLTLPWPAAFDVLGKIWPIIITLYPLVTAMLGLLLTRRMQRERLADALRKSEEAYRELVETTDAVAWEYDIGSDRWNYVGPQSVRKLGYEVEEWTNLDFWLSRIHPDDLRSVTELLAVCRSVGGSHTVRYRFLTKSGAYIWLRDSLSAETRDGRPVRLRGLMTDIGELKKVEEELRRLVEQKETLLLELQHRIKNNLNVISSLISLEARTLADEKGLSVLEDTRSRIRSMSAIYERLILSPDLANVELHAYIKNLAESIFDAYNIHAGRIRLSVRIETAVIDSRRAVPIGLILNELITNSLKYAYPDGRTGEVRVVLERTAPDTIRLCVADDGVGLPFGLDVEHTDSIGLTLVNVLSREVGGSLHFEIDNGTRVSLSLHL